MYSVTVCCSRFQLRSVLVSLRFRTLWGRRTRSSGSFAPCSSLCCSAPSSPSSVEVSSSPPPCSSKPTATGPRTTSPQVINWTTAVARHLKCFHRWFDCRYFFVSLFCLENIFLLVIIQTSHFCWQTTSRSWCRRAAAPPECRCPASWSEVQQLTHTPVVVLFHFYRTANTLIGLSAMQKSYKDGFIF